MKIRFDCYIILSDRAYCKPKISGKGGRSGIDTVAVTAEFNPLHDGHRYLLGELRRRGAKKIIVIMSGNFVQRGEPAIFSTRDRERDALDAGADLVVRLPLPWALGSADDFARGAAALACAFPEVDTLAFGSESADKDLIKRAAALLERDDVNDDIKQLCASISYPAAVYRAVAAVDDDAAMTLRSPNDTLGVAYTAALSRLSGDVDIMPIKRIPAKSAKEIRADFFAGRSAPRHETYDPQRLSLSVLSVLRSLLREAFFTVTDSCGGVAERLIKALDTAADLDGLYAAVRSKTVTLARVKRVVMRLYLGIPDGISEGCPPFVRVRAMQKDAAPLLRGVRIPTVIRPSDLDGADERARRIFELESRAADMYSLLFDPPKQRGLEYTQGVVVSNKKMID